MNIRTCSEGSAGYKNYKCQSYLHDALLVFEMEAELWKNPADFHMGPLSQVPLLKKKLLSCTQRAFPPRVLPLSLCAVKDQTTERRLRRKTSTLIKRLTFKMCTKRNTLKQMVHYIYMDYVFLKLFLHPSDSR